MINIEKSDAALFRELGIAARSCRSSPDLFFPGTTLATSAKTRGKLIGAQLRNALRNGSQSTAIVAHAHVSSPTGPTVAASVLSFSRSGLS